MTAGRGVFAEKGNDKQSVFFLDETSLRARAGDGDAEAQCYLGLALRNGYNHCVINEVEGGKWLQEVAKQQPETVGGIMAQGICSRQGIGVVIKNEEKAEDLYNKAAESKTPLALYLYGNRLSYKALKTTTRKVATGTYNVLVDDTTTEVNDPDMMQLAIRYLTESAEAGCGAAQYRLGVLFEWGYGVTRDNGQAFKLYKMAADGGCAEGKKRLALCHQYAKGTPQIDLTLARQLLYSARDQGLDVKTEIAACPVAPTNCCLVL